MFTLNPNIPDINLEELNRFNNEAGPGEARDSIFIHKIMAKLWSEEILCNRSISGKKSNLHKSKKQDIKEPLEKVKIDFIYGKSVII